MKIIEKTILVMSLMALSGCCKDDSPEPMEQGPLPAALANFLIDPIAVEVGIPVMFDNLSLNASRYEWDLGDQTTSSEISPTTTYTEAGLVTVSLRAFTEDDQVSEITKDIQVRERVLTGYFVNIFPVSNSGAAWDPGLPSADQFADIYVEMTPQDPVNPNGISDGIFGNVPFGPFGNVVDPTTSRIVLTDEDWTFTLFDFDGTDPAIINEGNTEFIAEVLFNPVQERTFKNEEGDGGTVSLLFIDSEGNILDVDFSFELQ